MLTVYVASTLNYNLIDKYINKSCLKKIPGETFSLCEFIKRNMQLYSNCTDLVLERNVFEESDEEFCEYLKQFKLIYNARVTVYCENASDTLIKALADIEIYNIVTADTVEKLDEEFNLCFNSGMDKEYWNKKCPELFYVESPIENNISFSFENANFTKIYFYGSQSRVGTTISALLLARFLKGKGAKVAFIDKQMKTIPLIMQNFESEENTDILTCKGIDFSYKIPNGDYDFIILDNGTNLTRNSEDGIKVLLGGYHLSEKALTEKAVSQLCPDVLIVNYANEKLQNELSSKFPDQTMYFPKFSENFDLLSNDTINESMYMKIAKQAMEFTAHKEIEEEMVV